MIRFRRTPATTRSDAAVPFKLVGGRIVIEAMLDGRPVTAIIDSGAPMSLVRSELARSGKAQPARRTTFLSEHGPVTASLAGPARFMIGSTTMTLPSLIVLPSAFLAETGVDADIVIGQDFMAAAVVEIDFERHRIQLHNRWQQPSDYVIIPIDLDDSRRIVAHLELESIGRVPAIIDLGNNAALTMDAAFVREHRLADSVSISSGLFATLGGVSETLAFSLPSFSIGGLPVLDVPVDALPRWSSPQPINIGMDVLRRFCLTLDLATAKIGLRPIPGVEFEREMSGVLIAHRGAYLEVVHVARRSPAETAGMLRGSRIIAINGHQVDMNYFKGELWRWRYGPQGDLIDLAMSDGNHRFRLERYY